MFNKILIANRGEIAVRIARTCRELNIPTVALYQAPDQGSLHARLADECVLLDAPGGFMNGAALLEIAHAKGADAIHPGYGFLAEQAEFIRVCEHTGITFIGPPARVVEMTADKVKALERAQAAGIATPTFSAQCFDNHTSAEIHAQADELGYPLVVKSCRGGRGPGEHLVQHRENLEAVVQRAQQEAHAVYGDRRVYFEKAILPVYQLSVQILADARGNLIQLGEREGTLLLGNQKLIEEMPAPSLQPEQRERLRQLALDIARVFEYENAGTVEFLMDAAGNFYFTEIKARIQVEHPLTEMLTHVDLVRAQIELAAGATLPYRQDEIQFDGWAMMARLSAQDAWNRFMPSPGRLYRVRLPGGLGVRCDTYVYSGCDVPAEYDPLIAKLTVGGIDRAMCRRRLERALDEFKLIGAATTLPLLQQLVREPLFAQGMYRTPHKAQKLQTAQTSWQTRRDLAAAVAIYYERANQTFQPTTPARVQSGWHRASRALPE
ncbi:MAG: acetyl-CoA carboxylase biotin carboxylase subunit [Chloroflexota bacterium]|nr:MAG: acetyl-CoA carboxylase biotin carboxylase subunit [Chloroflexota bacterium]